jgi:hypothetical protein
MLTDLCIYAIKHSDDLRESHEKGGRDKYRERKTWARGKELLNGARKSGKRLPIIFAPAEATLELFAWALVDEIVAGESTTYTFSELRLFNLRPHKSTLRKARDGEPLGESFIRSYAIRHTPDYLVQQPAASGPATGS